MRKFVIRALVLAALLAGNAVFATEAHATDYPSRCVWVQTGGGGCAQGCEGWLVWDCGLGDVCYDPTGHCTPQQQ